MHETNSCLKGKCETRENKGYVKIKDFTVVLGYVLLKFVQMVAPPI